MEKEPLHFGCGHGSYGKTSSEIFNDFRWVDLAFSEAKRLGPDEHGNTYDYDCLVRHMEIRTPSEKGAAREYLSRVRHQIGADEYRYSLKEEDGSLAYSEAENCLDVLLDVCSSEKYFRDVLYQNEEIETIEIYRPNEFERIMKSLNEPKKDDEVIETLEDDESLSFFKSLAADD
jgi:hypothetical protein